MSSTHQISNHCINSEWGKKFNKGIQKHDHDLQDIDFFWIIELLNIVLWLYFTQWYHKPFLVPINNTMWVSICFKRFLTTYFKYIFQSNSCIYKSGFKWISIHKGEWKGRKLTTRDVKHKRNLEKIWNPQFHITLSNAYVHHLTIWNTLENTFLQWYNSLALLYYLWISLVLCIKWFSKWFSISMLVWLFLSETQYLYFNLERCQHEFHLLFHDQNSSCVHFEILLSYWSTNTSLSPNISITSSVS